MESPRAVTRLPVRFAPTGAPIPLAIHYPAVPVGDVRSHARRSHVRDHQDNGMMRPQSNPLGAVPHTDRRLP